MEQGKCILNVTLIFLEWIHNLMCYFYRCRTAAVLTVEHRKGILASAATAPCSFHYCEGTVIESSSPITLSIPVLKKISSIPGQSHCVSLLTRPVSNRDADPIEQLVYLAAISCNSRLDEDAVEVYLVIESSVPFTKSQLSCLQNLVPIVKAELDVHKLKNELKFVVHALKSIEEEKATREERIDRVSWALNSQMATFQFLYFISSFSECSGFNDNIFWHEREHLYDDVEGSNSKHIRMAHTKTTVTIEDISDSLTSIVACINAEMNKATVVEIHYDMLHPKEKKGFGRHATRNVRFSLEENQSGGIVYQYSLLALKDNCCVAAFSERVGESSLFIPIGQLTSSPDGNYGGNAYVLAVSFTSEKALSAFLANTEHETNFHEMWNRDLPRPHADMIPLIRIDNSTSSIISKKLEPSSCSINFLFHTTLSIRKCLEVQNFNLLRKIDAVATVFFFSYD